MEWGEGVGGGVGGSRNPFLGKYHNIIFKRHTFLTKMT